MQERVVVSVGGSLIVPDEIDAAFLSAFKALVLEKIERGFSFAVIAGGGKTARRYQEAARGVANLSASDLDWLGIHATRLNGHLLRTVLEEVAYPVMITNPDEVQDAPKEARVIVAAGYRPGASTDLRAVEIAKHLGATRLVNLSNIDYAYTADPKQDPNAQKIEKISWADFRKLIPHEWDPGLSAPFDPVAAREAESLGLEVAIMNGAHLERLTSYLDGEPFIGTIIA
ncbi:MAG: UMP kinase [Patescibacteria group bacterium]|nr:UMP kinase [Patescibacteria group bacterium]MDE1945231.1 UMP kinase [Patescibacteria group bacterium]MDE2057972.1 UMP kinase [Patescibacteria group bacterium]